MASTGYRPSGAQAAHRPQDHGQIAMNAPMPQNAAGSDWTPELDDAQWARIAHLLRGKPEDRGSTGRDNRLFVEAVLWMARSRATWRDLPPHFGAWNSVFRRYRRWQEAGVWQQLSEALGGETRFDPAPQRRRRG